MPGFFVLWLFMPRLLLAAEGSDSRLGPNNKYKLLAVLLKKGTDRPLAYTLTNSFQVSCSDSCVCRQSWIAAVSAG